MWLKCDLQSAVCQSTSKQTLFTFDSAYRTNRNLSLENRSDYFRHSLILLHWISSAYSDRKGARATTTTNERKKERIDLTSQIEWQYRHSNRIKTINAWINTCSSLRKRLDTWKRPNDVPSATTKHFTSSTDASLATRVASSFVATPVKNE